jgi:hypothetical protein
MDIDLGVQCVSAPAGPLTFYDWMKKDCPLKIDGTPTGACMNTYYPSGSSCEAVSGYCDTCQK